MLHITLRSCSTFAIAMLCTAFPVSAQLGSLDKDLVFVPINGCRIVDTRVAGAALVAGTSRDFDITAVSNYSFQGGEASDCNGFGNAGSFAAVALNFTIINPNASGTLKAWPYLATEPPTAQSMAFAAGEVRSNFHIVKLDQGASASELWVKASVGAHLTIDVVGYFKAAPLPTLSCVNTAETIDTVPAGATRNTVAPACAAGSVATSTNCETSTWQMPFVYISDGTCSAQNNSSGSAQLRASRTCCRIVP